MSDTVQPVAALAAGDIEVTAATLDALISHKHMVETGNAAAVRRVEKLGPLGVYRRAAPVALDLSEVPEARQAAVAAAYARLEQPFTFVRCLMLKDAMIVGQGSVVARDRSLVRDSAAEPLARGLAPAGFAQGDGRSGSAALRLLPARTRKVAMTSLLLQRPWWRDYRHWLLDSAATLALATRLTLPQPWQIVIGRPDSEAMRAVVQDTCARLAPGVPVVEHPDGEIWQCNDLLWVTPPHGAGPYHHPEGLGNLRALLLREHVAGPRPGRRLFITQGPHPVRRLDNEAELAALAAARGFEVADISALDLMAQARLFHGAAFVAGAAGPGLANLLFCPSGTDCLVLSPADWTDPGLWDVASQSGVGYRELAGRLTTARRAPGHNDFVIDPQKFVALLPD